MTHFKFLDYENFNAIDFAGAKTLRDCICRNGRYQVKLFAVEDQEKEYMIFRYYEKDDEEALLPDHIWSRIFIGPAFGEGTQMLQHGLLSVPLCVINIGNEGSVFEVQNDGIVAFEVNFDKEVGKNIYLWMKSHTIEYVFERLGQEIIDGYIKGLSGGEAVNFLINKEI